jgi:thymidylate kinase
MKFIEIDGNDGLGKTTLVERVNSALEHLGLGAKVWDRGDMTRATDQVEGDVLPDSVKPANAVHYFLLDGSVELSQQRLAKAGKDLTEKYHTEEDLSHYRRMFLLVAEQFGATVLSAEAPTEELAVEVLSNSFPQLDKDEVRKALLTQNFS